MTFTFLTREFFDDYAGCAEIEQKGDRPYIRVEINVDGVLFGIPLRSNIRHPHVLWTDKENRCGVDFSKAVVITDPARYIDSSRRPYIRKNEFDALRGKEHQVKQKMKKYISDYKRAKIDLKIPRNRLIVRCSTLQYFEDYI